MLSEPKIIERKAQPYVAIRKIVKIPFGTAASKTLADLKSWMRKRGIEAVDAPFFHYNIIDMPSALEIDFGAPTAAEEEGDGTVVSGVLPAGRYASLTHTGPYKDLIEANGALLRWIHAEGLKLDMCKSPAGDVFGCRLEIYPSDPKVEKDRSKWVTELAFKLAD
ncbi:GyrI-like domain-containing protein [Chelativorans salis]|uniref:GyrI-like domain-containing protein n=1 Tax=Chelativorans salis TaxID=2978478 RepID=A0ABT2LIX0_9HYPH|nr:GyrI-like domain-containing protein [Chelativorans sp. EGI FJ00035]MCT7373964.1 GyrI-like domain-containing protein [Chelativorans sp. EGI FJ00035]